MDGTASSNRGLLKLVVALTPMAGTILFPLVVPILMLRVSIASGVIAAVVIGTLWFAAMLRTSEMPGHH
ncbi:MULTISPECIES: hypothetical protein [unclassified Cyanobium]|uniref:hypothetical protein n=1 Tax=unclassified Cyanobium TaxID=2627006 RepID=UPI0020CDA58A|nr:MULTISPECIES: hypothetical protein [unclassified Cyanobium]MCP9835441.1 hypothetical protein [Cyanobium sp. La Preciosa 7G6]MCP9938154.1 hypothetical protein [Cyanobium sp. Aljojuca 7A6]